MTLPRSLPLAAAPLLLCTGALGVAGCGQGIYALNDNARPLPAANAGERSYPPPGSLPVVEVDAGQWSTVKQAPIKPLCDARGAVPVADAKRSPT